MFAIPNAIGLTLFGVLTQVVANRQPGGKESLARFFDRFSKPFRLIFYLYQVIALSLTVFALTKYLFLPLGIVSGAMVPLYAFMAIFVVLAAGCLFGEEFGIERIKAGHAFFGILLLGCVITIFFLMDGFGSKKLPWSDVDTLDWGGASLTAYAIPLVIGLLVGPWLDLQHWQRAIRIHSEGSSIRLSYIFGGLLFFLILIFHGSLAAYVMSKGGVADFGGTNPLDKFAYAHELIVEYMSRLDGGLTGVLPTAYFVFLAICVLTTLDSGYVALKWFQAENFRKSDNVLLGMIPKRIIESPIPSFLIVALVALVGLALKFELEYYMVFYASFFVGYAALAIARCFVPNSQHPLPQIRMFSLASISLMVFAFGYYKTIPALMILGSLLPLGYVIWLVVSEDLLRIVHDRAEEVMEAAAEIPALKTIAKPIKAEVAKTEVTEPNVGDLYHLNGHFEGKWFVYSFTATYQDTNSVGNVYFGMYALFVGKTRELFFNAAMPDFDLKTTKFYILTRSFEHKFIRESREFDTITVKIKVGDVNRKFCSLEHQVFGSDNELLGKGKQSLLFVSSKDYSLLDIPGEVHTAFMPYL